MQSFHFKIGEDLGIDMMLIVLYDFGIFGLYDFGDISLVGLRVIGVINRMFLGRKRILYFEISIGLAIIEKSIHYE